MALAAVLGAALSLCGCAGNGMEGAGAPVDFTDSTLAGDLLSTQLAALHHALPGTWQWSAGGNRAPIACIVGAPARARPTAQAASASYRYRGSLGLDAATFIYGGTATAQQALGTFASGAQEGCLAGHLRTELRARGYLAGSPRVASLALPGIGSEARTVEIQVRALYAHRAYLCHLEEIAVRVGRRIDVLVTSARVQYARYGRQLAAALTRVTAVTERFLETGQVGSEPAAKG